jgi:TonB-dependent starch-binding outer membrane protein SusC
MKPLKIIFLISLFVGKAWASGQPLNSVLEQKINISFEKKEIKEIMQAIEAQAGVKFTYKSRILDNLPKVSIRAKDESLALVLDKLFKPNALKYKILGKQVVISKAQKAELLQSIPFSNEASKILINLASVSGKVVDENNQALIGVSVKVKGTTQGTITNAEGNFNMEIANPNATLVFSYIGYLNQEVALNGKSSLNIKMKPDDKSLEEVVVVGYGTRKRSELTGAVTTIKSEMITKQPITSIDQGLAGMVPGVTLREGTGAPGSGPEILVRGINTFGNNKPLIVIDDVIFENGNDQNNNPLALLNPEDIENIVILKDASTKAIYGSRATAGVILITTKKGSEGKPTVKFSTSFGSSSVMPFERPDVLNATELAQFYKDVNIDRIRATNALYSNPSTPVPDDLIPEKFRNPSQYGVGTNWFDEVTQTAGNHTQNLSIQGGSNTVKYFVSGNFLKQEGVVINNDLTRFSLRANIDMKINKMLRVGLNLNPSRTEQNRPADDPGSGQFSAYGSITSTYWIDPSSPVYSSKDVYKYTTQGAITSNWTANPVYQLNAENEKRRSSQLLFGTFLEFEPIKNLVFKSSVSSNYTQRRSRNFQPSTLVGDGSLTPVFPNLDGARALLFNESVTNVNLDNLLRYTLRKDKHNIVGMVGYTVQNQNAETSTVSTRRIIDESFKLPDLLNTDRTAGALNGSASEEFGESRLISYISRLNYTFGEKYFLNASLRRDGSSRFGRNVQFGNFPSASAGWRLSKEPFFEDISINGLIQDLRIELGYGVTGNNSISNYGHLGSYAPTSYPFGNVLAPGTNLNTLPNEFVTWEESKQWDLGINGKILKDRINFAFNTYQAITEGPLAQIPLSWITGAGNVVGNQEGRLRNRGFELQLDLVPVRNKNVVWTTGLNISRYKNKILEYFDPKGFVNANAGNGTGVVISKPGEPIGMFRGLKTLGLFTQAQIDDPNIPKYLGAREGSQNYVDGDGDGKLEIEEDYVILGNPHPDLMFGWNNQLSYKNFTLRGVFSGQLGGLIYDLRREIMWNIDGNFNIGRDMLDRWRPGDDPSTKTFPTTTSLAGTTSRYVRFPSDNKIYDGSYLALKNLYLGYNLGRLGQFKNLKIAKACELYTSVRNVFYLASYKYGNPEVRRANEGSAARSINYGSYPISRVFTLGATFTF